MYLFILSCFIHMMCQIGLYQETSLTMNEIVNSVTACISCSKISFLQFSYTFHIPISNIFHIFQLFFCLYTYLLGTDAFARFSFVLRLLFFVVFWNHRFTFLFVYLPQFLSKLTEKGVPADFFPCYTL